MQLPWPKTTPQNEQIELHWEDDVPFETEEAMREMSGTWGAWHVGREQLTFVRPITAELGHRAVADHTFKWWTVETARNGSGT